MDRELSRLVLVLVMLRDPELVPEDEQPLLDELSALTQVIQERVRWTTAPPYHTTPRGQAAIARIPER